MRYVVIGGGISGLAAAQGILSAEPQAQVQVLEASDRVGGKLRGELVAGRMVDVGAEAVLARRREGVDLIEKVGLASELVHPTGASAQIWSRGQLHPVPRRTMMGVPADPGDLAGLLTQEEVQRASAEVLPTPPHDDVSVAQLIGDSLGPAVAERLVEPLLGGVYAGHASLLSAAATIPVLFEAARQGTSLLETVSQMVPGTATYTAGGRKPVFAAVTGGMHRLPAVLAERLIALGAQIETGTIVRELRRAGEGFEIVTGPRPDPTTYSADRVVLAVPAAAAARLLGHLSPSAATLLARIESASMAVITLALDAARIRELSLEGRSGVLVPPVEGGTLKASTFSASKWDWVREAGRGAGPEGEDLYYIRGSVGRHREEASLQVSDEELVQTCLRELGQILGAQIPTPVATHVQRWGGGLPQYGVGHLSLIAQVRTELAQIEGLVACGAAFDGVGIAPCISSAQRAVAELLDTGGTMAP